MEENKIIKYEGGVVVRHVSKAISTTNKILSLNERLKIIEFFYSHPDYFIDLISSYYPLDENTIDKYKGILKWKKISSNESIQWSDSLLEKYIKYLNWDKVSSNKAILWDNELIRKYSNYLNWNALLFNKNINLTEEFIESNLHKFSWVSLSSSKLIPWSENLIEKHKDSWLWALLCQNAGIPWSENIIEKYSDRLIWGFTQEELMEAYHEKKVIKNTPPFYVSRFGSSGTADINRHIPWTESLLNKYKGKNWWWSWSINETLIWSSSLIKKYENELNWDYLSANRSIPWTETLIDQFIDKWSWFQLCFNTSLPWSEELMEKYKHKISWFHLIINTSVPWTLPLIEKYYLYFTIDKKSYLSRLAEAKLSFWTDKLIDTYYDSLYWPALSHNPSLPWSVSLIEKYENNWEWKNMGIVEQWEKAFMSFVDNSMIEDVMSKISKK